MMNNHHWMFDIIGSLVIYHRLSNWLATMDRVTSLSGETRYHSCQQPCVTAGISVVCICIMRAGPSLCFSMHMWMLQMATVSYQTWTNTKESRRTSRYFRMIWKERTLSLINLSGIHLRQCSFWWISCTHHGIWQGGLPLRMTWLWRQTSCNRTRTYIDLCNVLTSI